MRVLFTLRKPDYEQSFPDVQPVECDVVLFENVREVEARGGKHWIHFTDGTPPHVVEGPSFIRFEEFPDAPPDSPADIGPLAGYAHGDCSVDVTREEAERLAVDGGEVYGEHESDTVRRLARTVVALDDAIDNMPALAQTIMAGWTMLTIDGSIRLIRNEQGVPAFVRDDRLALLSIIDRLRSGWSAGNLAASRHDGRPVPGGWCWSRGSGQTYERESMTPEQAAVMAP
jgi:hypothetical protein